MKRLNTTLSQALQAIKKKANEFRTRAVACKVTGYKGKLKKKTDQRDG
jgi:hypothetical protein